MIASLEAKKKKHKVSVTRRIRSGMMTMASVTSRGKHLTLPYALLKVASGMRNRIRAKLDYPVRIVRWLANSGWRTLAHA